MVEPQQLTQEVAVARIEIQIDPHIKTFSNYFLLHKMKIKLS